MLSVWLNHFKKSLLHSSISLLYNDLILPVINKISLLLVAEVWVSGTVVSLGSTPVSRHSDFSDAYRNVLNALLNEKVKKKCI